VRLGKSFYIVRGAGMSWAAARADLDRIAREILSNPVIEDFRVEIRQ
jgi:phosphoribosylformylglycinamidine (FGAM) synthase PurS component